ncbi:exodeoxyribonuclease III [Candidatus Gracilibacteria bacterium]|nr:exodeoxyribonuclease III [Candidatus Gracilibacteria bacterium]
MKIISWNVNGIRAVAKKGFHDFVTQYNPDILCIQETKAFEDQFLKDVGELEGYSYIWHSGERPGYAGTAIFYRSSLEILEQKNTFEGIDHFHTDGRVTQIETPDFVLLNGYFPNGGTRADGTEMLTYKLDFYNHLIDYCNALKESGKEIIITGDFNICHQAIDIARPKENEKTIGFLPIEREKIGEFFINGYTDVWREKNPDLSDVYSWWSVRAGARPRNVGWRIDYFAVTDNILKKVDNIKYLTDVMGSDHCPVMLELK